MKKVILVEDDSDTVGVVDIILQDAGFLVININRQLPVEEVAAIKPDLVIVDFLLPFGLGNELCAELKSHPKTKDIPVILYSANYLAPKVAEDCKADAFIPKPFDIDDFVNTVKMFAN